MLNTEKWSTLMWVYLALAILGFLLPTYYNIQFALTAEVPATLGNWWKACFVSPVTSSISYDLIIGTAAFLVWMLVEGVRLKMDNLWMYVIATFVIAFSFTAPLFLFFREMTLLQKKK